MEVNRDYALTLLQSMLGKEATFRPGQWEAIHTVAVQRKRALVVQYTGWGKSLVYFLSTKLLRDQGAGPTLMISPLLSLMRNQMDMAQRIGVRAFTINSGNREEWEVVEGAISDDQCDLLLVSPERLNNKRFLDKIFPHMSSKTGLFVVDEAHCISDWGHDFRPDYRRITRILQRLPKGVPVLGTTATANDRVIQDVQAQMGSELTVLRGSLARSSLRLQNIVLPSQSERMAWLVENLPVLLKLGSGIIYCLTVPDAKQVAAWLKQKGFSAEAYHAGDDDVIDRPALEQAFLKNELKILVATVALGMGFDKPDIAFIVHFQKPGSVVAYYQQVGRAGRAVERAYGILLSGTEDDDIHKYFIDSAFPSMDIMKDILKTLEKHEKLLLSEILRDVNISRSMVEKALKLLEVDGLVGQDENKYFRTSNPWRPDNRKIERIMSLRWDELEQMQEYVAYQKCLMEFLQKALDDPHPVPCGRCANCQGKGFPAKASPQLVEEAEKFLKYQFIQIKPRQQWPNGLFPDLKRNIPKENRNEVGCSLSIYGDAGWGTRVRDGKYKHTFYSDDLVDAAVDLIKERWNPQPFPKWVTAIPSLRHPTLVPGFAERLAKKLKLPFITVLERTGQAEEQKLMQNSTMQARNVYRTLEVKGKILDQPLLLIDDIIDSGWTLTMAGYILRKKGSGLVYPFTLANAAAKKG